MKRIIRTVVRTVRLSPLCADTLAVPVDMRGGGEVHLPDAAVESGVAWCHILEAHGARHGAGGNIGVDGRPLGLMRPYDAAHVAEGGTADVLQDHLAVVGAAHDVHRARTARVR